MSPIDNAGANSVSTSGLQTTPTGAPELLRRGDAVAEWYARSGQVLSGELAAERERNRRDPFGSGPEGYPAAGKELSKYADLLGAHPESGRPWVEVISDEATARREQVAGMTDRELADLRDGLDMSLFILEEHVEEALKAERATGIDGVAIGEVRGPDLDGPDLGF